MELKELKELAIQEFGQNLENATPVKVRNFIARLQKELHPSLVAPPYPVPEEGAVSYQQVMQEFFRKVFELPPEQAAALLWLTAFEMVFEAMPDDS